MAQKPFLIRGSLAILLAAGIWFPSVHWFFSGSGGKSFSKTSIPQKARELAARQLQMWTDPKQRTHELERMRRSNAEWDFMGRGFLVWSLAEMGLREPALKAAYLPIIDRIIDETVRLETEQGIHFFLMPYSKARPYVVQPPRSHFLDGEIALMLAMRRTLEEKAEYRAPLTERVNLMIERMSKSKVLAAESYPDECWMFDHAVALAAIKLADHLDGSDHAAFFRQWVATARKELIHPDTGLLISSFTTEGRSLDGPEGSSIWMVAHCLRLIDEDFAGDQYRRARKELGFRGKARWISILARSFRCSAPAPAGAAWHSSAPVRLGM